MSTTTYIEKLSRIEKDEYQKAAFDKVDAKHKLEQDDVMSESAKAGSRPCIGRPQVETHHGAHP